MLHCKRRLMWNISKNMIYTPYFFRRNRDIGTISVYVVYRDVRCLPPLYTYGYGIYIYIDIYGVVYAYVYAYAHIW